jgi:hypothetical protein
MNFDTPVNCPVLIDSENDLQRLERLIAQAQEAKRVFPVGNWL